MKLKGILLTSCITAMLGVGVFAGVSASNNAPVKEAEAWGTNWYYIGADTSWGWNDSYKFTLNSALNRYESPVITMTGQQFKLTLNKNWNDYELNANDWGDGSKPVDWNEWGNFCSNAGGNFQFVNNSKKIIMYFNASDMGSYERPGYAIHFEYYHTYKVSNGSTQVNMSRISPGGDCSIQYEGVLDVDAGQVLSFTEDTTSITSSVAVQSSSGNNAFTDTKKVIDAKTSAHVYLKYNSGNWFYYLTGRVSSYIMVVGSTAHNMVVNPAADPGNYMLTGIELAASSTFKLYGDGYFAPSGANFGQDDGLGFSSNGTVVTCSKAGIYNIYLDVTGSPAKLYIGGQSTADIKATAFANDFLDAFDASRGGICNANGSTGAAYESSISSTWATLLSNYNSNVKGNTDAVNILKNADSIADTAYGKFAALYDKIYADYGAKLSLTNFANRTVVTSGGAVTPNIRVNSDPAVTITTAVIASIVAAGTIAGFLFLKKKKLIK